MNKPRTLRKATPDEASPPRHGRLRAVDADTPFIPLTTAPAEGEFGTRPVPPPRTRPKKPQDAPPRAHRKPVPRTWETNNPTAQRLADLKARNASLREQLERLQGEHDPMEKRS